MPIDDHLNSSRYNKMDQMTIVERLFHYHDQLGLAKEVIKLLEQERRIYRQAVEQCTCTKNSEQSLMKLDNELQSIYQQCNFDIPALKDTTQTISTVPSSSPFTSSKMLGIDMKTFLSNQNAWDLGLKSNNSLSRKRKWRCSVAKCRFNSFTEKSLIRHQLQHRKEQFLSLIEPYGFNLSYDYQIIYCPENSTCDKKDLADQTNCWFPFCNYQFPILSSNDSKTSIQDDIKMYIDHLREHVSAYILHPCYNCLQVFDSEKKLKHHFQTQTMCRFYTEKYATNNQTLFDNSNDVDSLMDIENIESKQNKSWNRFRLRCNRCANQDSYSDFRLFNLHVNLLHTGMNPNILMEIVEDNCETSVCHTDPNSIYCKLCKQIIFSNNDKDCSVDETVLLKLKQDHAKLLHNFDEEFMSIDLIYSDSNNYRVKENSMPGRSTIFDSDPNLNNIGMEVFIENTNTHNDEDFAEDFINTNANNNGDNDDNNDDNNDDGGGQPSNFAPVFYDDHNYNIERKPVPNKNRSPSSLPSLIQPSDDHDDYTKNISDVLSDVFHDHSMIVADDAAQYGIIFEASKPDKNPPSSSNDGKNSDSHQIVVESSHPEKYSPETVASTQNVTPVIFDAGIPEKSQASSKSIVDAQSPFYENAVCFQKLKDNNKNNIKRLMSLYIYECALCTYSFRSENELSTHNYLVHKIASFHCSYCDYVTQDTEKYHVHEKKHQAETIDLIGENVQPTIKQSMKINSILTFVCMICSETFKTQDKLNAHVEGKHAKFRCEICQMIMTNRAILNSHMASFHRDSLKRCDQCIYRTYDEVNFRKHQRKHQEYKICPFEDCGDLFPTDETLEAHVNKFHKMIKPYHCDECEQKFLTQKILNKHLLDKHNRPIYNCDKCDYKCNTRHSFRFHLESHSNIKPIKCPERGCFKSFRNRYHLESHRKYKHTQLKSIKCSSENCSEMFKTKPQMQQHFRLNHSSTTVKPTMVSLPAKTVSSNNNKRSNDSNHIQYYVFGNINVGDDAKSTNEPKSTTTTTMSISAGSNSRSLMIKPALLRPTSSISSTSTSILTTTIIPINDDHDDNEEEERRRG